MSGTDTLHSSDETLRASLFDIGQLSYFQLPAPIRAGAEDGYLEARHRLWLVRYHEMDVRDESLPKPFRGKFPRESTGLDVFSAFLLLSTEAKWLVQVQQWLLRLVILSKVAPADSTLIAHRYTNDLFHNFWFHFLSDSEREEVEEYGRLLEARHARMPSGDE